MSSASEPSQEIYPLQRNVLASTRLNLQHYLWHHALGYNIHPSVPIKSEARICDVATGTALWLLEVAEQHEHSQCDGLDINLAQAPRSAWLPKNVFLREWDMMSAALPPASEGIYDFVHVRLVTLAIEKDAGPLVRNLWKLLKPGGWLQWDEVDFSDRMLLKCADDGCEESADEEGAVGRMTRMMLVRSNTEWFTKMSDLLSAHGFNDVKRYTTGVEKKMIKFETDLSLMVWDEVVASAKGEKKTIFEKLVDGVKTEVAQGTGFAFAKTVTVAKKPNE